MAFLSQLSQARQGAYIPPFGLYVCKRRIVFRQKTPLFQTHGTLQTTLHLSTHACDQLTDGSTDSSVLKLPFFYTLHTQVRARPLSDTNPEISKYMEAVAGPSAGVGGIASLARRGRGDVDADSMGYDEVRYPEIHMATLAVFFLPVV